MNDRLPFRWQGKQLVGLLLSVAVVWLIHLSLSVLVQDPTPVAEARFVRPTNTPTATPTATATRTPSPTPTQRGAATSTQTPCPTPTSTVSAIDTCTMLFSSDRAGGSLEIFSMQVAPNPNPGTIKQITPANSGYDSWWPRISPNRQQVVLQRAPAGDRDTNPAQTSIWVMNADGSNLHVVRPAGSDGWAGQGHPEWSPSGTQIVLHGGPNANQPQIFVIDAVSGAIDTQVTNNTDANLDPSWSASDPNNLLYVACPPIFGNVYFCTGSSLEVYRIPATGGTAVRLTTNGAQDDDPYMSHHADRIAWEQDTNPSANNGAGSWHIWMMNSNGTGVADITPDGSISSVPQWSWAPNDQWIYLHRVTAPATTFGIYRMAPAGGVAIVPILVDGFTNDYPGL